LRVRESTGGKRSGDGRGPSFGPNQELPFPESTYLIDQSRRLIYIPIPKVACTSLKTWFLQTSPTIETRPDPATWKVNLWLGDEGRRYLLSEMASLHGDDNFHFTFVRNPWSRLVSAYLNRIVGRGVEYRKLMTKLSRGPWYRPDKRVLHGVRKRISGVGWAERSEVTFRQFVMREVAVASPVEMDPHWRPQHAFLGLHRLDFIGRSERLAQDLRVLREKLGIREELPERNRSRYLDHDGRECFADCSQARLRDMPAKPGYRQFYTPDLVDEVARVYSEDILRFGYDF